MNRALTLQLGSRRIGDGAPCLLVAEAGSNHDGRLEQAQQLIEAAAGAGVDAVKFQLFRARTLYARGAGSSDYLGDPRSIYDIVEGLEVPYDWLPELARRCEACGVLFLASACDEESVDRLDPFVPAHKITSYEITHLPLVRYIAGKHKPVIMSTGAASLDEVREAVETVRATSDAPLVLLHCTASYPAPMASLNLRAMATMREAFGVPVGLSDHSRDPVVGPLAAVAQGACVIEKHVTLSNTLAGPDHKFAVEPAELSLMVRSVRDAEAALGTGEKISQAVEAELRTFARRSIFAVQPIVAGTRLTPENVAVLRCGKLVGRLAPREFPKILGHTAARSIGAGAAIRPEDVAGTSSKEIQPA